MYAAKDGNVTNIFVIVKFSGGLQCMCVCVYVGVWSLDQVCKEEHTVPRIKTKEKHHCFASEHINCSPIKWQNGNGEKAMRRSTKNHFSIWNVTMAFSNWFTRINCY